MNGRGPWQYAIEDESCWRVRPADRVAVLVNRARYFGALRSSLLQARRTIFVIGWDIDSRTPIRGREPPRDGAPETLGPLLAHLAERRPRLRIHVLLWDCSLLYALEHEPGPRLDLDWRTPGNVRVRLDSQLPPGACHHQKLVVVDDTVAYCGGTDLAVGRRDESDRRPDHPERAGIAGRTGGACHDVQVAVHGEAAVALSRLARARWAEAGGGAVPWLKLGAAAWPAGIEPDLRDVGVGIARTLPPLPGRGAAREVEALYLRAIAAAQRFIYIENQYVTAVGVAEALACRVREMPDLEVLIVVPRDPGGWLEARTMDLRRRHFLRHIGRAPLADRVHVAYPWVRKDGDGRREAVRVQSSIMIVDDELFVAGSANLTHRSMTFDSECNLAVEGRSGETRGAIARLRHRLMGEHLGIGADALAEREGRGESPLAIAYASGSADSAREAGSADSADSAREAGSAGSAREADRARGLAPLRGREPAGDDDAAATGEAAETGVSTAPDEAIAIANHRDPERPIRPLGEAIGDSFGAYDSRPDSRRVLKLAGVVAAIAAVAGLWQFTPMARWTDPDALGPLLAAVQTSPWAVPAVLAMFILGTLVVLPVTALIAAAAIALGPWSGLLWASVGSMAAALLTYLLGQAMGRRPLERLLGQWIYRVDRRLRQGGIISVFLMRTMPVAPFTIVNVVAGASSLRFRDFLLGTVLGMGPGIAAITLLSDRLRALWEDPTLGSLTLLVVAIVFWFGVVYGLHVLSRQLARR